VAETVPVQKTKLNRNQIRGFWAAWSGWCLDGMDSFIYALVLVLALRELLPRSGIRANTGEVGYYGGILFAWFLVGWVLSLLWGPVGDRFGRVRTLMPGRFSVVAVGRGNQGSTAPRLTTPRGRY
jgi:MFS family permease